MQGDAICTDSFTVGKKRSVASKTEQDYPQIDD
ncbi:hypothetical protein BSNT_09782 [Bacillus subtilis subsp. natto BEST195]|nr:hypothetical protein BSNT_09782 [Bacillus subtilis subsp. natto BEST195]